MTKYTPPAPPSPALRLHQQANGPAATLRCQALYDQILRDAIMSLAHPLRQFNSETKAQRRPEHIVQRLGLLQEWFLSTRDRGPFSFERCCLVMSLDPEAVRERLRADGLLQAPEVLIQTAGRQPASATRLQRAA